MTQVHDIAAIDNLGVVQCYHGLQVSLMTSKSANHSGRQYYCCPKDPSDPDRCSFWHWKNDLMSQQRDRNATASTSLPNFPTSSRNEQPTTPLQKKRSPTSDVTPSQKRLKPIQEALEIPSAHAQSEGRTPESAPNSPSKSKRRLEDIQLALSATKASTVGTKTSHTLADPPSPTPHHIITSQPSVPHGNVGKISASIRTEKIEDKDAELWVRVGIPRVQDVSLGSNVGTASTEKGSQEAIAGPSYSSWRDNEQNNLFNQFSRLFNSLSNSSPHNPAFTSFDSAFSDQSTETLTIGSFEELYGHVAKLGRRLLASEKSNSAKAKRISELEEIIERLQEENRTLGGPVKSPLPAKN